MAATAVITPVLPKAEICQIYQEIVCCYIELTYLQNSVLITLNAFLLVLEEPTYEGKN